MINRKSLMNYAQNLAGDSLDDGEVRQVVWDYLTKVYEGDTKWPSWPKEIKDLCASMGIIQDKDTGLPMPYEEIETAWSTRCVVAETNLKAAQHQIRVLEKQLTPGPNNVH